MPAPINVTLRGYLDWFGLKNGGRNPQVTAEFLQPNVDLTSWYLESREIEYYWQAAPIAADTGAAFIVPTGVTPTLEINGGFVVPHNEMWILLPGTLLELLYSDQGQEGYGTYAIQTAAGLRYTLPMKQQGWTRSPTIGLQFTNHFVLEANQFIAPGSLVRPYTNGLLATAGGGVDVTPNGALRLVRLRV